ncbi:MAG: hypothetical protein ACK5O8_01570, partial [Pirellula sp.]
MARTFWVVGHAMSMPLDACESPAQACTRSAESDNLHRIDKASMNLIVAEPQASVQTFYVPHRSGELSLTDGGLVFGPSMRLEACNSDLRKCRCGGDRRYLFIGCINVAACSARYFLTALLCENSKQ